jgi:uncharacterized protein (TIGR02246 family)
MNVTDISKKILKTLENGWNTADGAVFAQPFAQVSDFVDIRGMLHAGVTPGYIATAHQGLFRSIYEGSRIRYELAQATALRDDLILAHVVTSLNAPVGPLSGSHNSVVTMVVQQSNDQWEIRAFHNTLVFNSTGEA